MKEVAFEVRFPALLRIENELHRFQDKIRDDFPAVSKALSGVLSPSGGIVGSPETVWEFVNEEIQLRVKVRNNSLALISTEYKSFDVFYPKIKECTDHFLGTYEISDVSRIGLRYIDDHTFGGDYLQEYKKFFVPVFDSQRIQLEDVVSHQIAVRRRKGEHLLTSRLLLLEADDGYHYIMDTDSFHEERKVERGRILSIVEELHKNVIEEFHDYITDEFVSYLRGDVE